MRHDKLTGSRKISDLFRSLANVRRHSDIQRAHQPAPGYSVVYIARTYRDGHCIHARTCIHSRIVALRESRRAPHGVYRFPPPYKVDTYPDVGGAHPAQLGAAPLNQFRHIPRHNPPLRLGTSHVILEFQRRDRQRRKYSGFD